MKLNEQQQMSSDDDSSNEMIYHMNSGVLASNQELERKLAEAGRQRLHLRYMLDNQEILMYGSKFYSPLSKKLPDDKRKWMMHPEMKGSSLTPSNHKESGLNGPQGVLDHFKQVQQTCIYNRALFLWYYVHRGKQP